MKTDLNTNSTEPVAPPSQKATFRRILGLIQPMRSMLALGIFATMLVAISEPLFPQTLKYLLDNGFKQGAQTQQLLWLIPVAILAIFVLRGLATFTAGYCLAWVNNRMVEGLRQQMFNRLLVAPMAWFDSGAIGRTINAMVLEVNQVSGLIGACMTTLIRDSLTTIALFAYLIYLDPKLTLIVVVMIPSIALVIRTTNKRLRRLNEQQQALNAELTHTTEETLRAREVIRIGGGQNYEAERMAQKTRKLRGFAMRLTVAQGLTVPLTQLLAAGAVSVVIVVSMMRAADGTGSAGAFAAFMTAMLMLMSPLKHLAEVAGPLQRGLTAARAVFDTIDTETEKDTGKHVILTARGEIGISALNFRYPNAERNALNDINLQIQAGQTVALVGESGGGKSTLAQCLPRFIDAQSGSITLDGIALHDITLDSLRAQIAMVSQHVVLFDDTLAANIAYAQTEIDTPRLQAAVKAARLDEVVANLPNGLQTQLGNNGMRLSGGQRQRVAIARAIYKNAPILILDEATSALDAESERAVQAALSELMQGRTTLVIAHRLSTVERADKIVVLDQGKIAESGTHQELLSHNGLYAKLVSLQQLTAHESDII